MHSLNFTASAPFTIGVELEFQLLDEDSLNLAPRAPDLLAGIDEEYGERIKPEFIQSMVEICTPVCENMLQVEEQLSCFCRLLEDYAAQQNCVLFAASLHPFAQINERQLSPGERYKVIMDDLQLAGRRLISQAQHVHIGLPDAASAVLVCDHIRQYLPLFLALTTSSPFFEGEDTGFCSYRTNLFKTLPRTGIPEALQKWSSFENLIAILNEATLLEGIKELWWDVRPHPDFGTVEVRICDLPSRFDEILSIAALVQAVAATIIKAKPNHYPQREIIMQNKWNASRYSLDGTFVDPRPGRHTVMAKAVEELLEWVKPAADELGGTKYLQPIHRLLRQGTSAVRQRTLLKKHGDFTEVIHRLREDFWQ